MMDNLKRVWKKTQSIGYSILVIFMSTFFGFLGFVFGLSYPVWLFAITFILANPFQKKEKFETIWTKIDTFFVTYGGISMLLGIFYHAFWAEFPADALNRFASIDTIRSDFLSHPMYLVHTLCSFFATISVIRLQYHLLKNHV